MSGKFKHGRRGTEKFFKKHGSRNRDRNFERKREFREVSRYDPDARYS